MVDNIIFSLAILVSIYFLFVNFVKMIRNQTIPWPNIFIMSWALTAVITHIVGVW